MILQLTAASTGLTTCVPAPNAPHPSVEVVDSIHRQEDTTEPRVSQSWSNLWKQLLDPSTSPTISKRESSRATFTWIDSTRRIWSESHDDHKATASLLIVLASRLLSDCFGFALSPTQLLRIVFQTNKARDATTAVHNVKKIRSILDMACGKAPEIHVSAAGETDFNYPPSVCILQGVIALLKGVVALSKGAFALSEGARSKRIHPQSFQDWGVGTRKDGANGVVFSREKGCMSLPFSLSTMSHHTLAWHGINEEDHRVCGVNIMNQRNEFEMNAI